MMRSYTVHCLTVLLVLCLLTAAPAKANVCDRFEKPLTADSFAETAAEVRSLFPEQYQQTLDKVTLSVDEEQYDIIELATSENGNEITVSATYLQTSCALAVWALRSDSLSTADRKADATLATKACSKSVSIALRECILGFMHGFVDGLENGLTDRRDIEIQTPILRKMVISSFVFALAHEYSHVLLDAKQTQFAKLAQSDNESAADLQALSIYGSGRAWPVSDSLLFSGRRVFDVLVGQDDKEATSHDASYCRAKRSDLIRQQIVPSINVINIWRSNQDPSFIFTILSTFMNDLAIGNPDPRSDCDLTLPPEVLAMASEFSALARWAEAWPQDPTKQKHSVQTLLGIQTLTEAATAAKGGMISSYTVAPGTQAINGMLDGSLTREQGLAWATRFAFTDNALRKKGALSSIDWRKNRLARIFSDLIATPAGTSMDDALRKADASIEQARDYEKMDAFDLMWIGSFHLLRGNCRQGLTVAADATRLLPNLMQEAGSLYALYGRMSLEELREANRETETAASQDLASLLTAENLQKCDINVKIVREQLATKMGWTLSN